MTPPVVLAGTSGFAYRAWIPSFYPAGTKQKDLLTAYAARLPAVELNNTYYRMPTPAAAAGWRAQVPAGFRFAVKAPMWWTVSRKPVNQAAAVAELRAALEPLGPTLGCLLLQFPAHVGCDLPRLAGWLQALPPDWRCACEFAQPSWQCADVDALLNAHGGTRVVRDDDDDDGTGSSAPRLGDFAWQYARLRRAEYTATALAAWRRRLQAASHGASFAFFRHEDTGCGPRFAAALVAGAAGA
ncbi:MAG: DUF72 domain-containing protein [Phycisphaerales bacterium]|nr:DUF72 domain-containing protein [Phycisphaerales bacterium]